MSEVLLSNVNPNLAYLGLIASLWAVVTIVYTPGTIVGEVLSGVLTIATLITLRQLPTNWLAVLVIVLGVSGFLLVPFISLKWANVADVGLLLQLAGGFFLFEGGKAVSPLIMVASILLAWSYYRFILLPALRRHHNASEFDHSTAIVGAYGRVVRAVDPIGTVFINGEMWTARSTEVLPKDLEVVVVEKKGLELLVKKAKRHDNSEQEP